MLWKITLQCSNKYANFWRQTFVNEKICITVNTGKISNQIKMIICSVPTTMPVVRRSFPIVVVLLFTGTDADEDFRISRNFDQPLVSDSFLLWVVILTVPILFFQNFLCKYFWNWSKHGCKVKDLFVRVRSVLFSLFFVEGSSKIVSSLKLLQLYAPINIKISCTP